MTSANVTHYELYGRDMRLIDTGRQHALCKDQIGEKLEQWEEDYPDALLALRWPDEYEVDQYLTFDEIDGYPEDLGTEQFMEQERDMCTLRVYMKRKREYQIGHLESMLQSVRKSLWEYTGDPCTEDYDQMKAFREFKKEAKEIAEELGPDVRAKCDVNGGNFTREFLLTLRRPDDVKMAKEAVSHFYSTGRVPTYDEPYPKED